MKSTVTKVRIRKSEKLTEEEHRAFKAWMSAQPTKLDAAESLSLSRSNLDRIAVLGSCAPATAIKIRDVLGLLQSA